jgi:T5SS/PEP-CTERM-associated repeat protein
MSAGTIRIAEGIAVADSSGYLGYRIGSYGRATVTGAGSKWTNSYLYIGFEGSGELNIEAGGQVSAIAASYIGGATYSGTSKGTATVTGIGSKWITGNLYIGNTGKGTMKVEEGGQVSSSTTYIGDWTPAIGTVTVNGTGSQWTNTNYLYVGYSGSGTLNILGGGAVAARILYIMNTQSLLAIDVGTGSNLTVGNGNSNDMFTNNGQLRILAGASLATNATYTPITATWSSYSTGTIQTLGGIWNATNHSFTVSDTQISDSGVPVTVDLLSTQRLLIGDSGSGWTLGASFAAVASSKPLTLTATAIGDGTLTALENLAGPGQDVLGGWNLSATSGYAAGDPVYLSFDTGGIYSREFLQLWSYNGSSWTKVAASDVNFDGKYVNFTVTSMSGYAVTVPEPGTVVLLACGLMGLAAVVWRKRKR